MGGLPCIGAEALDEDIGAFNCENNRRVCLRAVGWRVSIFERSAGLMDDRGAGIVLQSEVLNLLEGLKLATRADISVESLERQYLNQDGSVASSGDSQQFMTSWGRCSTACDAGFQTMTFTLALSS